YARRATPRSIAIDSAVAAGFMLLPALIAVSLLRLAMPIDRAVEGVLASWRWSFAGSLLELRYFQTVTGTDRPGDNLLRSLFPAAWYARALVPPIVAGLFFRRPTTLEARIVLTIAAALVPLAASYVLRDALDWMYIPRGLNVAMVEICLVFTLGAMSLGRAE